MLPLALLLAGLLTLLAGCGPENTAVPTPAPTAAPAPGGPGETQPVAAISPASGPPGTQVQVVAGGLPPDSEVQLGMGLAYSEYDVIGTAATDAQGGLQVMAQIPGSAAPGEQWVVVVAADEGRVKAISNPFDVTGQAQPVNIYLIALEDAGQSGKLIGCNDSVVPVPITVAPGSEPLRAALEALLAIDEQQVGQSGLYNALYQADLQVQDVSITGGTAVIGLAGTFLMGGVCDAPRIEAQLHETALQFPTIQRVSVFINGTSLEQLLSGS